MYRRGSGVKKVIIIILATLLACLLIVYIAGIVYYKKHIFANTAYGSIDLSNCTHDEVERRLNTLLNDYKLTINARDKVTEVISSSDVGLEYDMNDFGKQLIDEQNEWAWPFKMSDNKIEITEFGVKYDDAKFQAATARLGILQEENIIKPENAYLSDYISGEGYQIVKEVVGNEIDVPVFVKIIGEAITSLEESVNLEEKGVYIDPTVFSDDKALKKRAKYLNKFVSTEITYQFGGDTMVIDGDTVHDWMKIKKNGKVSISEEKVKDFVNQMGSTYDTIFRSRKFKTSYGQTITVEGGDYGWWMNRSKEVEEIISLIKKGEVTERVPEYFQKAASYGESDIGDSYVEINLTAQHLYVYKDGAVVLESDFVSGKSTKDRKTPVGTYGVTYKERDATLVGEDYETPVSYWMPFNGSVGMHDAIWRSQFGSSIYKSSGSHGCINLPFLTARKIYGIIDKGWPVICYELEGTQSGHVTSQGDEEKAQFVVDAIDRIGSIEKSRIPILEKTLPRIADAYKELSGNQRRYVTNYDKYEKAVKDFNALKKGA